MKALTVNIGVDFALHNDLMPTFLQPVFVIVVQSLEDVRVLTYGFVAQTPDQVVGDRPDSKRTPFSVRLITDNLLAPHAGEPGLTGARKWHCPPQQLPPAT